MKLSEANCAPLLEALSAIGAIPVRFRRGDRIQTASGTPELILISEGQVRFLDPDRSFGSFTISVEPAPVLTGLGAWLEAPLGEECLASSDGLGHRLAPLLRGPYAASTEAWLANALQQLVPIETSRLQQWLAARPIKATAAGQQTPSLETLLGQTCLWTPWTQPNGREDQSQLFYADRGQHGFSYGQAITEAMLQRSWREGERWPRVIAWHPEGWKEPPEPIEAPALSRSSSPMALASVDPSPLPDTGTSAEPTGARSGNRGLDKETVTAGLTQELRRLADQFPWTKARSSTEWHSGILSAIVGHFGLPTRRDVIRRGGDVLTERGPSLSLETYLNVVEQLGLDGRLINVRVEDSSRLPVPSLMLLESGEPLLIVHCNLKGLIWLRPEIGLGETARADLEGLIGEKGRILHLSAGRHTPQKTFGLNWLLPYLNRHRVGLTEVFVASFFAQLFALGSPMLFQQIIDRVIGQGSHDSLAGLTILMVLFSVLEIAFGSLRTFQFVEISNRIDIQLGSTIIGRLLRLNMRYFEKKPIGELSSRLNELETIRRFLTSTALTAVLDVVFAILYLGVMVFYSVTLTLVILGTVPLLILATVGLGPITQKLLRARAEAYSRSQSLMVEILNGIQTIKVQNSESTARRNWEDRQLEAINKGFKTIAANTISSNTLQFINKISAILVITVGSWLVIQNQMTLGELIAFRIISGYVTQPILRLSSTWQGFQEASLSLERLGDIVNQPLETSEHEASNITMPKLLGDIAFEGVSFSYSQTTRPQLNGVSLKVGTGSFTGLVGQSGCGKSTLLKLVPRLYSPSQGKILIDGLDVAKVELYSLRRQIGFVPQDCLLFEGSIYSNIAIADPEAETDQVIRASQLACAHDFIMGLPYGYSTPVGEKGSGLSGGQRQRIALARMLLQDPEMVILDEATSALDADTEQQVVANIRQALAGRTILMITHRLSTLQHADQIVVMHEGRLDSQGTHSELMALAGRYYVLYQQQFGGE